eukprot:CAMPEP_0174853036 /NCGR_PEP_ID=MMETSP1114-20130205/27326_1 /TAXON_ID=312471 /ORGANISM="Neobodo designis, Strain CCAP 1951/1" /LENGTH=426 /DNA_ID=CAMNT_0016087657 /DNA_START=29 /DNA_END=1306 /DNA_ORIENTATION=+
MDDSARRVKPKDHWFGIVVAVIIFLCQFGIYGSTNSYSLFAHQISEDESLGKPSSTEVSFGNSIGNGLAPVMAIVAGALCDRVGPRVVLITACVLTSAGWLLSSFAENTITLILSYSLPVCLGSACLSTPGGAAVSSWLDKRLSLGMGIAYSGNGAGSSVIVPIAGVLASNLQWRTSFRIMALFPTIGLVAALFLSFRTAPEPRKPLSPQERRFLAALLSSRAFWILWTSGVLFSFTFFAVLYIIVPFGSSYGEPGTFYAQYSRIEVSKAATLFTFFGVFKWVGSLTLGTLAHRTEPRLVFGSCAGLVGLTLSLWPLSTVYYQLAIGASVVGFGFAGMFATLPAMTAKCFAGKFAGLAIGATMSSFAVGGFSGPPVILAIKAASAGSLTGSFGAMGLAVVSSGAVCFVCGNGYLGHQRFASDADPE